jgi:hypothetical protein
MIDGREFYILREYIELDYGLINPKHVDYASERDYKLYFIDDLTFFPLLSCNTTVRVLLIFY